MNTNPWFRVFSLALAIDDRIRAGGSGAADPVNVAEVREALVSALRDAETEVSRTWTGSRQGLDDARYAVASLVDERLTLGGGDDGFRAAWEGRPLEFELFGTKERGRGFFERLDRWLERPQAPREVLEVFHTALGLGFAGRLFERPRELERLREEVARRLPLLGSSSQSAKHAAGRPERSRLSEVLTWVLLVAGTVAVAVVGHRWVEQSWARVYPETNIEVEGGAR
ncbi:MAG: DotU family type IV/VI secretion system protein [Planctomycetota bacterium]